jgi:membrane-bound ClpP family serine protease
MTMLRLAGVRLHPGIRLVIGAALVAFGLWRHDAAPAIVIGGALILFGLAGLVGSPQNNGAEAGSRRR